MPANHDSCFASVILAWWTNETHSQFHEQRLPIEGSVSTVLEDLEEGVSYYLQVNLFALPDVTVYGDTRSFVMTPSFWSAAPERTNKDSIDSSVSSQGTVPLALLIAAAVVGSLLVLLAILVACLCRQKCCGGRGDRDRQKLKNGLYDGRLSISSPLNPNGDFMQNLTPQWPEPEPEEQRVMADFPAETDSFLQHEREKHLRRLRRGSKTSISSSWSSLFNVPGGGGGDGSGGGAGGGSVRSSVVSAGVNPVGGQGYRMSFVSNSRNVP